MSRRSDIERDLRDLGFTPGLGRKHKYATHPDHPGARVWYATTGGDVRANKNALALARRVLRATN